ncbi:MAG: tyrosine-type recombinase/integrase [Pseudomonadales bacterium]|nr:tyrosine-type recombinase/integrase [Pseudomonadales bacterium]
MSHSKSFNGAFDSLGPLKGGDLLLHQSPDPDPFTFEEKMATLDKLDGQAKTYFTLAFETGARIGELLTLTWNDYDGKYLNIDKAIVRQVLKASTKTYIKRKVLLTPRPKEVLNR